MSQGDLSERMCDAGVNWSQGTLSRIERGDRSVRAVELPALARALDTKVATIVGDHTQASAAILDRLSDEMHGAEDAASELRRELEYQLAQLDKERWTLDRAYLAVETIQAYARGVVTRDLTSDDVAHLHVLELFEVVALVREAGATDDELSSITPSAVGNSPKARAQKAEDDWLRNGVTPILRAIAQRVRKEQHRG